MQQVIFYRLVDASGALFKGGIFHDFDGAISALNYFDDQRLFIKKIVFVCSPEVCDA